ncbi:MAG: shikimate dehydrogenase family protein [Flavobacteriales bacterium]
MNVLGLIGKTLKHSWSAEIFKSKFDAAGLNYFKYALFEVQDITDLNLLLEREPQLSGFNVTIPYKQAVIPFLDELDEQAAALQVVNTVSIEERNGRRYLAGYNTDYQGFRNSIKPLLKFYHERALVLGDGATAQTVSKVLRDIGLDVNQVGRKHRGNGLLHWDDINDNVIHHHLVIINTTPIGMYPDVEKYPLIPYQTIGTSHLIYDVIYNPEETAFLRKCLAQGAQVENGLSMLQLQAEAAWQIWKSKNGW